MTSPPGPLSFNKERGKIEWGKRGSAPLEHPKLSFLCLLVLCVVIVLGACSQKQEPKIGPPFDIVIPSWESIGLGFVSFFEFSIAGPYGRDTSIIAYHRRVGISKDKTLKMFMDIAVFANEQDAHAYFPREASHLRELSFWTTVAEWSSDYALPYTATQILELLGGREGPDDYLGWGKEEHHWEGLVSGITFPYPKPYAVRGAIFRVGRYVGSYSIEDADAFEYFGPWDYYLTLRSDARDALYKAMVDTIPRLRAITEKA